MEETKAGDAVVAAGGKQGGGGAAPTAAAGAGAGGDGDSNVPVIRFKKRGKARGSRVRKRSRRQRRASSSEDESAVVATKRSRTKVNTFSTKSAGKAVEDAALIKSKGDAAPVKYAGDATYTLEIDTAHDRDARALLEKHIDLVGDGEGDGAGVKVYRGQAGYSTFVKKSKDKVGLNKVTGTLGPLRAPKNLRNTCRFDYQPDVCKDYKDTGYCGFGDTCKFLHDRGDYKQGWQIEREWQEKQRRKQMGDDSASDDDKYAVSSDDEDALPFACHICREGFTNPVRTKCDHYFCLKCAMARFKQSTTCAVCKAETEGIFNAAPRLEARLAEQRKADAAAAGGGDGDGDDDVADDASDSSGGIVGSVDSDAAEESAAALARKADARRLAALAADKDDGADVGGWEAVDSDG